MVVCQLAAGPPHDSSYLTYHPQLGRLTHYAFDAVLLSAFLAGVKRSTGLTYVPPSTRTFSAGSDPNIQPQLEIRIFDRIARHSRLDRSLSVDGRDGDGSECGDHGE